MAGTAVLVEDNLMFALRVTPGLQRLGYQVRTVAAGTGAVDRIAIAEPTLLVISLAGRGAAELIRAVRGRDALASLPVLGYAGHVERELLQAGRDAGADLVAPNSAVVKALPEVLDKLRRRRETGDEPDEWDED